MEQALAHVRVDEFEEALALFRELAEMNQRDFEVRVWVARIESWQQNYTRAEELYHGVLRDNPGNLEAELGLADVLSWQGRYREAMDRLAQLGTRHPGNTEVLLRQAKISRWQRHRREATAYYEEVLAVEPGNPEALEALALLRAETFYRLETGYFLQDFDFAGNTNGNFVELLYHDNYRLWLLGRFQYQNKFEQNNTRYTAGATYRFWARTYLRGEFSWSPAGDTVIANQDYTAELVQGLPQGVALGGSYRFINFQNADVHVVTSLLNWDIRPDLHFYFRYTPARTRFEATDTSVWNHGGWTRLVWDANRIVSPYVLFAVGAENFATVSAEKLGRFSAQTYGVGAEFRVTPRQGFRVQYYYQNRTRSTREQSLGVSYFWRF